MNSPITSMDMSVRSLGDADISNVLKYTPHLTSTEHSLVSVKPKNINHISLGLNITWNLFNLKMNHIFLLQYISLLHLKIYYLEHFRCIFDSLIVSDKFIHNFISYVAIQCLTYYMINVKSNLFFVITIYNNFADIHVHKCLHLCSPF